MFANQNELFKYNESKRVHLPTWVVLCFSFYIVWQMAITFFSDTSLSLYNKVPLPITATHTIFIIFAGYIISAISLYLFPGKNILVLRTLFVISIFTAFLLYLPLPSRLLVFVYYLQSFICVYTIAGYVAIICPLFTEDTELKRIAISAILLGTFGALLHFENISVPFAVFNTVALISQILVLISLFCLPANPDIYYIKSKGKNISDIKVRPPKILVLGFLFTGGFTGLLYCFCSAIVESTSNGISLSHLFTIIGAVFLVLLLKFQVPATKIFSIYISIFFLGFIFSLISINMPNVSYVSCIFFGFSMFICDFYTYFGILAFAKYPSKILAPGIALLALLSVIIHSLMLELLRTNLTILYSIYVVIAAILIIVYFFIEPYFSRTLKQVYEIKLLAAGEIKKPSYFEKLSEQESILANLILDGYAESSISKIMNITLNTQKSYRKNLYNKLQIHSKRELFMMAKK